MIRSELVQNLASERPDIAHADIERALAIFIEEITAHLSTGGRVELRGFGSFSTRARVARVGRNPKNGKAVPIVAKRVPIFKPSKDMYSLLNTR